MAVTVLGIVRNKTFSWQSTLKEAYACLFASSLGRIAAHRQIRLLLGHVFAGCASRRLSGMRHHACQAIRAERQDRKDVGRPVEQDPAPLRRKTLPLRSVQIAVL
jgi:hypothetical protein